MSADAPFSPGTQESHQPDLPEISDTHDERQRGIPFNGSIRPIAPGDTEHIRPILEEAVRDSTTGQPRYDEIGAYLAAMERSAQGGGDRSYVVAQSEEGQIVGVMGLTAPNDDIRAYAETNNPIEIVNAYVAGSQRGGGVGKHLYASLEEQARAMGATEALVMSGPRNEKYYPFWNGLLGQPVAIIKNHYGEGADAPVWRKRLVES